MSKGSKGKKKARAKAAGGGDGGSSSGTEANSTSLTLAPVLSLSNLSAAGKEGGTGRPGEKEREKDASHNCEGCLLHVEKEASSGDASWEKLPARKLEKFLADVNQQGGITIPLEEVLQEIELVTCQSCLQKLRETLAGCLETSQPTQICSSIKVVPAETGGGSSSSTAMTVISPLSGMHIPVLKDLVGSAGSSKTEEEVHRMVMEVLGEEKEKVRFASGDSTALGPSMLGQPATLADLVQMVDEGFRRAAETAPLLKSKLPLADHEDTSPRPFTEWGPRHNVNHVIQGMDSLLTRWIDNLTKLVSRVSRLEPFILFFPSDQSKEKLREVVNGVWNAYEAGMDHILDFSIKARQDQMRETNMHGLFGICLATKSNTQKIKSMLRKKAILDEMCEGIMRYCREGTEYRIVLNEAARLARVQDDYFVSEQWQTLESLEEEILNVRTHLVQENTTFNFVGRGELVQHDQHLENQLKKLLNDWENALDKMQPMLLESSQTLLAPSAFPQTKGVTKDLQDREAEFKKDWESHKDTYQLQARISQQEVTSLNSEAHVHKQKIRALKNSSDKDAKKKATKRGEGAVTGGGGKAEGEETAGEGASGNGASGEEEELSTKLNAHLTMTHQKQLEHCLRFRSFASRNYVARMRMLREFHLYVRWMVGLKPKLEQSLCADSTHALKKIRLMLGRQLLKRLDRECNSWQARQVEAQLVEDAQREEEKRRRKDQRKQAKNQSAKQQKEEVAVASKTETEERPVVKAPEPAKRALDVEPSWQLGHAEEDESMDGWTTVAERDPGTTGRGSSNRRRQQQQESRAFVSRLSRHAPRESAQTPPAPAPAPAPASQPPAPIQTEQGAPGPVPAPASAPAPVARRTADAWSARAAAATSSTEMTQSGSPANEVAVKAAPALHQEVGAGSHGGGGEESQATAGPGSEESPYQGTGHHTPVAMPEKPTMPPMEEMSAPSSPPPPVVEQAEMVVEEEEEEDVSIVFGDVVAESVSSCQEEEEEEEIAFGEGFVVELDDEDDQPPAGEVPVDVSTDGEEESGEEQGHEEGQDGGEYEVEGRGEVELREMATTLAQEGSVEDPSSRHESYSTEMDGRDEYQEEAHGLPLPPPPPTVDAENGAAGSPHQLPPPYVAAPPYYFQPNGPNGAGAGPPFDPMVTPSYPPPPHAYPGVYQGPGRGPYPMGPPHPPHMDVPQTPPGPMYHPQQMNPALARGPMPYVEPPSNTGANGKYKSPNGGPGMRGREAWGRGGGGGGGGGGGSFHRHANHPLPHQPFRGPPRGQNGVGYGTLDLQPARSPQPMAVHVLHPPPGNPNGANPNPSTPPIPPPHEAPQQQQPHPPFVFFPPYSHHPHHSGVSPPPPHPHPHGDSPHNYMAYDAAVMYGASSPHNRPRGPPPHAMPPPRGYPSCSPEKVVPSSRHHVEVLIDVQPYQGLHQHRRPSEGEMAAPETLEMGSHGLHGVPEVGNRETKGQPESSGEEQDRHDEGMMSSPVFGSAGVDVGEVMDASLPPAEPPRPYGEEQAVEEAVPTGSPVKSSHSDSSALAPAVSISPAAVGTGAAGGVHLGKSTRKRGKGHGGSQESRQDTESRPVGLSNKVGQNHCFLNVVVQCLWNLDSFREGYCESQPPGLESPTSSGANAPSPGAAVVDHALRSIFRGMADLGSLEAAAEKPHISVDRLRQALSDIAGENSLFRLGHMDDAIEAFEKILGYLSEGRGDTARVVQETFNLRMREMMTCPSCSRSWPNPPHDYDTTVFYVPVRQLKEAAKLGKGTSKPSSRPQTFDFLLQTAGNGGVYSCQNMDGCHLARRGIKQTGHRYLLSGPPQVFSLGLVWDTLRVNQEEVTSILRLIEPTLNLEAFQLPAPAGRGPRESSGSSGPRAELRAFFCFHPQKHHYVAFLSHRPSGQWVCIDDTDVQVLGPAHSDATAQCAKLQYQPILFFYSLIPGTGEEHSGSGEPQPTTIPAPLPYSAANSSRMATPPSTKTGVGGSQTSSPPLDFSDDVLFPSLTVNGTGPRVVKASSRTTASGRA